ncbi:MAG TPA: uracil-DNA glycosylase [Gemmatimonadales bacterium]|nr:uracil-DNA glycosylase [Gemmatimonadales bacterium]
MTDARALAAEYLKQQRLLGGDSVILSDRLTVGPSDRDNTPPPAPERAVTVPSDGPTVRPSDALPPAGIRFDPPSADLFAADPIQRAADLQDVATLIAACRKCKLCEARTNTVPGEGPATARLVVIGEGPGRTEDETGRPFVGRAGELLTKILEAIKLPRDQVFICNVVKCRPPENRLPQYDEIAACLPFLYRQIELVKPTVILAMGGTAAQSLLNTKQSLGALRNHVHRFRGIPVVVTYHPAALLRNPNWKRPTWDDVRIAARLLDN